MALLQPVILSGGSGTRLWPLSRKTFPKQFLPLTGDRTLLQEAVTRLDGLEDGELVVNPPLVISNEDHRFLVAEQLRALGLSNNGILLEPVGRNTAPALTLAALHATRDGEDPLLLVMPADHHIPGGELFQEAVRQGLRYANQGALVTFGIVPTRPETGYGYIRQGQALEAGGFVLDAFVEKPDAATAQRYLDEGGYLWNSGIFLMRASVWLREIARHRPDVTAACGAAIGQARSDGDFLHMDAKGFAACPADSIDYAVMEKVTDGDEATTQAVVVPLDAGWSDVGSWSALLEVKEQDEDGNVGLGDVVLEDSHDTLVVAQRRLVAALGVNHLIIVETPDAILVADKKKAQEVKQITEHLAREQREEHLVHTQVHRPWGSYESIDQGKRFQVKRLTVNPGETLSLQMHHHRAEHWIVVQGTARVTRGEEVELLTENQSTYIPLGVRHRLENPGVIPLELIEVQSGSYLGEDDIVRFEDIYNRVEETTQE